MINLSYGMCTYLIVKQINKKLPHFAYMNFCMFELIKVLIVIWQFIIKDSIRHAKKFSLKAQSAFSFAKHRDHVMN